MLLPEGDGLDLLRVDFDAMRADGLLLDNQITFDQLVDKIRLLESEIKTATS